MASLVNLSKYLRNKQYQYYINYRKERKKERRKESTTFCEASISLVLKSDIKRKENFWPISFMGMTQKSQTKYISAN